MCSSVFKIKQITPEKPNLKNVHELDNETYIDIASLHAPHAHKIKYTYFLQRTLSYQMEVKYHQLNGRTTQTGER